MVRLFWMATKPKQPPPNFLDLRANAQKRKTPLPQETRRSQMERYRKVLSRWLKRVRSLDKRWVVLGLLVGVVLLAIGLGALGHRRRYFPEGVVRQAHFALYYPANAPANFNVERSSIKGDGQAVFYVIRDDQRRPFYVSIQPMPADFDYAAFKQKFADTDESVVNIGSVLTGDAGVSLIASIRTVDNSWIIINAPDATTSAELQGLTRDFIKTD